LPLSLEVVEKTKNVKAFGPTFWITPTFLHQVVSAIYCAPFGKVSLTSVC